jgi:phosphoglucosamine mutase
MQVGVLPTPAIAHLVAELDADLGVMISASHNPMPDNGIKLFAAGGHKLPDAIEDEIEAGVGKAGNRPTGAAVGRVYEIPDALDRYVAHLLKATPHRLDGLRVVVDCANGAAWAAAPQAYREAGAEVIAIHALPDGENINDGCGSTHLDAVREAVLSEGADLGIAHDGDADRCLAVDAAGSLVDGDQIMAVLALALKEDAELAGDTVVATVMSNLGLHLAMREHGLELRTTAVGDRYVLEELRAGGFSLGGEQSGHVVLPAYATTGDGLLTGLRLLGVVARSGRPLSELATVMRRLPQVLVNVRVADRDALVGAAAVWRAVEAEAARLGDRGRVLVRPSGTEALVRVMVEAETEEEARAHAEAIAALVRSALS